MTGLFALYGPATGDLLTFGGRPIVHTSREELEWLLPSCRVVPVTDQDLRRRSPLPAMPISEHPALAGLSWPLDRAEFRTDSRGGSGPPSGRIRLWTSVGTTG
ncbi:MAG TPA: hypothetical protein VIU37_04595 [Candidatus Limnocylindrales bacterium]